MLQSKIIQRIWRDERGFVNTTDVMLMTTILGIGMIVGIVMLRNQVVQEFTDVGSAVGALNQTYVYSERISDFTLPDAANWLGVHFVNKSNYADEKDFGDVPDPIGAEPGGISVRSPAPVNPNTTPGED